MGLLRVLSSQSQLLYTGKINILTKDKNEYKGQVILKAGKCVFAQYMNEAGKESLYLAIAHDLYHGTYTFVSEPETVSDQEILFNLTIDQLMSESRAFYEDFLYAQKYRPKDDLKVMIDVQKCKLAEDLSKDDFHLLTVVSDFNKISDIIKKSTLNETRSIMSLVSLRKKKLLRVYQEVRE